MHQYLTKLIMWGIVNFLWIYDLCWIKKDCFSLFVRDVDSWARGTHKNHKNLVFTNIDSTAHSKLVAKTVY